MTLRSDADGFITSGEPVKNLTRAGGGKSEVLLSGILGEVRAIRQAVSPTARGGSNRAAELATIARFAPAEPTGSRKGEASAAARAAQPGTGRRSPGWTGREVAQPMQRDERGRFTKKATNGDAAEETASPSGPASATFGTLHGRGVGIASAIGGTGMEEADPAVKAFNEVAQPLARGYSMLSGGDRAERQKTGWFRKIFGELRMFRAEETGFSKAAGKSLKALEEKPEAGAAAGGGGMLGTVLNGIKTALPGIATVLGGLAAAMAPLLAMLKVTEWAADTSQDKERVDALNEGAAKPAKEALQTVGIDKDADIAKAREATLEKRDGEYSKEQAARAAFKPAGLKPGSREFEDAFYRDQQAKESAAAEQAKKSPLRRGWESVKGSIVSAAQRVGIDPGVLAKIANFESGFNPDAAPIAKDSAKNRVRQYDGRMAISSAHGLGQFTDDTWLGTLRKHGEKYGISNAGALTKDQAAKLRGDKDLQAAMLAEFTKENIEKGRAIGGKDDDANVYALHNLGSGDGPKLLSAVKSNPSMSVRDALMQGVKSDKQRARIEQVIAGNRSLYGDGSGSVKDAYDRMGKVMRNGESFAIRAREASRPPVMASMPKAPTIRAPSIPAAADTQPLTVPLSSSSKPQVVTVAQAPADVGQDLRDRRIAHIATGGVAN